MHEKFLLSLQEYIAAREFWIQLCNEALAADACVGIWVPWASNHQPNAEVDMDESIYSLYSATQNKSFRIAQFPSEGQSWEIYARIGMFGEGVFDPPIDYLLIGCVLSESTAETAKALITQWILPTTDSLQMDALISQMIPGC